MKLKEGHIVIHSWMRTELDLKGNDLLVYAIIFGLSQDGQSKFYGSLRYLSDWCGASKSGIQINLKNLLDRNLIIKEETYLNNVKHCYYMVNTTELYGMQQSDIPIQQSDIPIQQSCTNNIKDTIEDNIDIQKENTTYFPKSSDQPAKKQSKASKKLEYISRKLDSYNFSDEIQELILSYYQDKIEVGKLPGDNQIDLCLERLASAPEDLQKISLEKSIAGGWSSPVMFLDDVKDKTEVPGYHIHPDGDGNHYRSYTEEEKEKLRQKMANGTKF